MTNMTTTAESDLVTQFCDALNRELTVRTGHLEQVINSLTDKGLTFALNLIAALLILLGGWLAIRLIVTLIGTAVEKRAKKRSLFGNFIRNVTSKVCWIVLMVIVLGKLGVDITPLIAGLGVTGFILGFAFQESLSNLASGLMIAVNEPFKIGDYVIVAGHEGSVLKMDMMAAVLVTSNNTKIVIPNKSAWGSPIVNFTVLGRRRVDIRIGIGYDADVVKAIRIALDALQTVPGVLADPKPAVSVASLDDSQVTLNIRPWAEGADYWTVHSNTQVAVKRAFEQNGISIPFPQLAVHMDKQAPC